MRHGKGTVGNTFVWHRNPRIIRRPRRTVPESPVDNITCLSGWVGVVIVEVRLRHFVRFDTTVVRVVDGHRSGPHVDHDTQWPTVFCRTVGHRVKSPLP